MRVLFLQFNLLVEPLLFIIPFTLFHLPRLKLPILAMEQEIMEAITANNVLIICGETGLSQASR